MTQPLRLTDMVNSTGGLRRVAHGYATSGTWMRLARRVAKTGIEITRALPRDLVHVIRGRKPAIKRMDSGHDPAKDATRIAMYVHYAAQGRISDMVRHQLFLLAHAGFAIVFISMSTDIPEDDWQAVREVCALVVQRANHGRDFGAWQDLLPAVKQRWPAAQELLLVNDSVLGPINPIEPVIAALRSGGDGLFGLTESLQGGPHLQSYMLLVRGRAAVADVMVFVEKAFVSHSKWLLIQMTELRLARWMRARGHRVAALFGYDRLVRAAVADPDQRRRLMASNKKLTGLDTMSPDQAVALLHTWPLNPTHHLWHVLVTQFSAPFVKTELVLHNPGRLPGVEAWPAVVPPDAACPLGMLRAHLDTVAAA